MPTKVRDKLQETDAGKRRLNWDRAVQSVTKQSKQEDSQQEPSVYSYPHSNARVKAVNVSFKITSLIPDVLRATTSPL